MTSQNPVYPTTCFPDETQEYLLRACLEKGEASLQAWREWRSRIDVERIDYGCFRLLPLLYRNLLEHRIEDPFLPRLKGVYRYIWARNIRTLRRVSVVLGRLHQEGIDTALLKGGALTLFVYQDYGARYMDDVDILVRLDQAPRAIELLGESGWSQKYPAIKPFIPMFHGTEFEDPQGVSLDLHWHLLTHCCSPEDDEAFWQGIRPVQMEGAPTHLLHPSDQLLHLCVHGTRWNTVHPLRWVVDATLLLRVFGEEIDWDRIVVLAERLSLSIRLRAALSYLKERFQAPVPAQTLAGLKAIPAPSWERSEYATESRARRWSSEFRVLWHRYHRTELSRRHRLKPYGFLKYLQGHRGLDRVWDVPVYLMKRFLAGTRENLRGPGHAPPKAKQEA